MAQITLPIPQEIGPLFTVNFKSIRLTAVAKTAVPLVCPEEFLTQPPQLLRRPEVRMGCAFRSRF